MATPDPETLNETSSLRLDTLWFYGTTTDASREDSHESVCRKWSVRRRKGTGIPDHLAHAHLVDRGVELASPCGILADPKEGRGVEEFGAARGPDRPRGDLRAVQVDLYGAQVERRCDVVPRRIGQVDGAGAHGRRGGAVHAAAEADLPVRIATGGAQLTAPAMMRSMRR